MEPAAEPSPACPHCGAPVEGAEDAFCCHGCELAWAIIHEAGLDRYYDEREAAAPRPEGSRGDLAAIPVELRDGRAVARVAIDGLTCASCVWVVENVLERTEGVVDAHVSYATGRATVAWDPARTDTVAVLSRIAALGYRPRPLDAPAARDDDLLIRLGVAVFAAMNVMLLAIGVYLGWWSGMAERYAALFRWTSLVLATPVALWSAAPFFVGAVTGLRARVLHMDLPIAIAIAALYVHGVAATALGADAYLDSLTMLVALLLGGRVLEARGRRSAAEAASAIAAALPTRARRMRGDQVEDVAVDALAVGDAVVVGTGEEIAADGVVAEGRGLVRMALLTGETEPVEVTVGDRVIAGATLVHGVLVIRVAHVGEDTLGRRMAREVMASVDRGIPPTPADRLAPWFTGGTLLVAGAALVAWSSAAGLGRGIEVAVSVLVVACPCALGLSTPLAVAAGLAALGQRGVVLRRGASLLDLAQVDTIALDKTGTVTEGAMAVVRAEDPVLRVAAGLERHSQHPIARAILDEARRRAIPLPAATDVVEVAGVGVTGVVDGRTWRLGRGGASAVVLEDDAGTASPIVLADRRRDDAAVAIRDLGALGLPVTLLTGDRREVAERIGAEVGAAAVESELSPDAKVAWIAARRSEGRRVLYVGDGLNDGPALVAADVSLAMRGGATASLLAADGVVLDEALRPLAHGVRIARDVRAAVRSNVTRSVVYNVAAVTAAVAGLVNPLVAAVLMPLSSSLVIARSLAVRRGE